MFWEWGMPDFDLNKFNKADHSQQRNRALADVYEPGSTFKIVAVCAAMNEGLVGAEDLIDCSIATVQRGSRRMRLPWRSSSVGQNLGKQSYAEIKQSRSRPIGDYAWVARDCMTTAGLLDSDKKLVLA